MPRHRRTLLSVALVVVVLTAGCVGGGSPATADADTPEQTVERRIQVTGSGSASADANKAVLEVGVVATAEEASTARQRLARNVSRMRDALERVGVDDDAVRTERYDIYRDRRRPERSDGEPQIRYRAQHVFEVTLTDIDRVGTVIDTAVDNGATEVEDIRFTLTQTRRSRLESAARRAAMADARAKAESLAEPANLTVTGVEVVRTDRSGVPRPSGYAATATPVATEAAGSAPSDVESGPVTVVTTVHVVYTADATADAGEGDDESETVAVEA